jgi:tetratricopeptide (TPR) repeat protein
VTREPARWRALMGLGLAQRGLGNLGPARTQLDAALRLQPANAELLAYSAELWLESGDLPQAMAQARASLAQVESPAARLVVGDCLARQRDFTGGFEAYLRVLSEPEAYLRIGEEALRLEEFERAVHYFQEAMRTSPAYNEQAAKRLAVARERLLDSKGRARAGG